LRYSSSTIQNGISHNFQGSIEQKKLSSLWFSMRQINFVIIFIFCLALALFALENTQPGTINIVPEVQVQAPIAIELLLAAGIGAVLAWLYSIWTHFLRLVLSGQQVRQKNVQIKELERKVEQYQAEVQSLKPVLPPVNDSVAKEAQVISQ
jgi:uncharacterized integral membrane protein